MSDRDELDARFASFAAAAAPALPGAAAAQERGAQRTRRTRAVLSGAGALVVVLVVTAGAALGGGGGSALREDRIGPAASGTPETVRGLEAALLDPEDVVAVRSGEWELRRTEDLPFDPLPPGCRGEVGVFDEVGGASALRFLDGPQEVVGHALLQYFERGAAEAVFGRLIDSIEECQSSSITLVGGLRGSGPDRIYGSYVQGDFLVGFGIERVEGVVSGVALRTERPPRGAEDEVLLQLPALADAAASDVRELPQAVDAVAEPLVSDGLLTAEDAATVEPGSWNVLPYTNEGDLLTPCGRATGPPPVVTAGTDLRLERESGGTFVYQQVLRFASSEDAAEALAERRYAVRACAEEPISREPVPDPAMDGTISYESIDTGQVPFVVRISTQCQTCPPSYSYGAVVQVEDRLAVLVVAVAEDGDPGAGLTLEYARVAAERLRAS